MNKFETLSDFWALVVEVWNQGAFGYDVGTILTALGVFLLFMAFRGLFTRFVLSRMHRWAEKTTNEVDDAIVDALKPPIRFIPVVMGIFFALSIFEFEGDGLELAGLVNRTLVVFTLFWILYSLAKPLGDLMQKGANFLTSEMIEWVAKALRIAFVLIGAAAILEIWGIEVGPLIAGLGLFGVAVALGAQDLFKNLIAGLFVIGERRLHTGDWILVDGVVEGTVESVGFRTTMVRRFDKAPVYVPNTKLADSALTNFSRMTYRRIRWNIGLTYDTSAAQLRAIRDAIAHYIETNDEFVKPVETSTFVRIDQFSASSIDLFLYCFTRTTDWLEWLEVKEELLLKIKEIVEENGASFAFPSQSLYIESLPGDPGDSTKASL
ncbi:mechanosensitive ion channel family protein [Gimibacter soli]|uniref:Mechanosensitive ion channel family protein n=1 Tax=Gimibacter soli TaxID=3024400 RepID=A0AAE9XMI5_9PROT|nr:mechanosensitive ion channel family protein [Gimibacter soli]WCL53539.1 mechanosensitive ion channel family protein [Gimibacter soli]